MKSLFWKTAYPCLGVRLCAFLVDLKSLWPCPDDHGFFSLGLVSCLFLLSHRGSSSFVSFFCLPFTPLLGRCFHWHNFVTNSRTEQFSQISCKLLYKCLEYSGSVFCLCSFCHVAWLITMLSLTVPPDTYRMSVCILHLKSPSVKFLHKTQQISFSFSMQKFDLISAARL